MNSISTIHLKLPDGVIVSQRITTKHWRRLERMLYDGEVHLDSLCDVCAQFMVDTDDNPIAVKDATKILDDLSLEQAQQLLQKLFEALGASTVPKANGSNSESPRAED